MRRGYANPNENGNREPAKQATNLRSHDGVASTTKEYQVITYNIFYRKYTGDYSELHKFTTFGADMMQALFLFAYHLGDKHEDLDNITIEKIEPVEERKDVNQADVKKTNIVKGQYIN